MNLPIFRDSSSDNTITYDDWRSEVDNFVREGHSSNLIRDSVLSALEGRPRHTAKAAMEDGDGSLRSVMSALDQVYGGAMTSLPLYSTSLTVFNRAMTNPPKITTSVYCKSGLSFRNSMPICFVKVIWSVRLRKPFSMA